MFLLFYTKNSNKNFLIRKKKNILKDDEENMNASFYHNSYIKKKMK